MKPRDGSVFLLEDEDKFQSLAQVLRLQKMRTTGATSGEDAIEKLRAGFRPCAIIFDSGISSGRQFLAAKVREPQLAAIPVVLLTDAAVRGEETMDPSVKGVFQSPIDPWKVASFVRKYYPYKAA